MAFQWLQMRIQEETERRERQAKNQERLPDALRDLHGHLAECIQDYTASFGCNSAEIVLLPDRIKVTVREEREGKWQALCKAEVISVPDMPGFRVECGEYSVAVELDLDVKCSLDLAHGSAEADPVAGPRFVVRAETLGS